MFDLEVMINVYELRKNENLLNEIPEGLRLPNHFFREFVLSVRRGIANEVIRLFDCLNDKQRERMLQGYNDIGVVNVKDFVNKINENSWDDDEEDCLREYFNKILELWEDHNIDCFNIFKFSLRFL